MNQNERKFDSRTVQRNIAKGLISQEEYEERLEKLRDLSDKCGPIESTMESVDDEDSDEE